jgi:sugar O-acyltransferase (sialic acid O-acetyltransferase NeuD family)
MDTTARELYIIGAGGFGREVADTVREINKADGPVYRIAGFVDDDESKWGKIVNDIEVKGGVDWLLGLGSGGQKPCAVITIAKPKIRENIAKKLYRYVNWINVIHPFASISISSTIGKGNIVQSFVSINANTKIGDHCIINYNSMIGHDVVLEEYVSIMPQCGIPGGCSLKKRAYIGIGTTMIQNIVIGEDVVIGAGSVVLKDVNRDTTVFGNPARLMK